MKEDIIWKAKPSQFLNWPVYLCYSIIGSSWILIPKKYLLYELSHGLMPGVYAWHLFCGISLLVLFPALTLFLKLVCTRYELTNERFRIYSGVLSRSREVIELYRVKDFKVVSPFYLRIFGFSNILVHTSDKTAPMLRIAAIKKGYEIEDLIRERVEEMRKLKGVREFD